MNLSDRDALESRLVALLRDEERDSVPSDVLDGAFARVAATAQRSRRLPMRGTTAPRRISTSRRIGLLGIAAVMGIMAGVIGTGGTPNVDRSVARETASQLAPAPSVGVVATVDLGFRPHTIAAGLGAIWVAGVTDEYATPATIARVDAITHAVTTVTVATTACDGGFYGWAPIGVGFGSLWIVDCGGDRIIRVEPATGRIEASFTGLVGPGEQSPGSLVAFDGSSAYVVRNSRSTQIDRVDPSTNLATPLVDLHEPTLDIKVDGSWLWTRTRSAMSKIDLSTGTIVSTTPTETATGIYTSGDAVIVDRTPWVIDSASRIVVVDGTRRGTSFEIAGVPDRFAFAQGRVWTVRDFFSLVSIDPTRRVVVDTLPIEKGDGGIASLGDSIWVGAVDGQKLLEIRVP
jgi:hypothetical protein